MTGYYSTPAWKALRQATLQRDGYACTTPGCGATAAKGYRLYVDHLLARRAGGRDELANLVVRCARCDNQAKEAADGQRRGGGTPRAHGCGLDGTPADLTNWHHAPREKSLATGARDRPGPYSRVSSPLRRGGR